MSRKQEVMLTRVEASPILVSTSFVGFDGASVTYTPRKADFLFAFSDFSVAETKVDLRLLIEEHVRHQAIHASDVTRRAFYNELQMNWKPDHIQAADLKLHRYSLRYWQKACDVVKEDRTILELCSSDPVDLTDHVSESCDSFDHLIAVSIDLMRMKLRTELNLDKIQELMSALSIKPATDYMHHDALYNFQLKGTAIFQRNNRS